MGGVPGAFGRPRPPAPGPWSRRHPAPLAGISGLAGAFGGVCRPAVGCGSSWLVTQSPRPWGDCDEAGALVLGCVLQGLGQVAGHHVHRLGLRGRRGPRGDPWTRTGTATGLLGALSRAEPHRTYHTAAYVGMCVSAGLSPGPAFSYRHVPCHPLGRPRGTNGVRPRAPRPWAGSDGPRGMPVVSRLRRRTRAWGSPARRPKENRVPCR